MNWDAWQEIEDVYKVLTRSKASYENEFFIFIKNDHCKEFKWNNSDAELENLLMALKKFYLGYSIDHDKKHECSNFDQEVSVQYQFNSN